MAKTNNQSLQRLRKTATDRIKGMPTTPRILIVERDAIAGQAIQHTLEKKGYSTGLAHSAEQAIDLIEKARSVAVNEPFGVVLVEQDVSGLGKGIDLVQQLHHDWPCVVAVLISGFRKVESAVQAMRLGAADYLLKPIEEHELFDAVERAMQRHLLLFEHETAQPAAEEDDEQPITDQPHRATGSNDDGDTDSWTPMPLSEAMKEPEQRILLAALEANDWNRSETAKQLDINRTTLYKKIRQYRLDEPAA